MEAAAEDFAKKRKHPKVGLISFGLAVTTIAIGLLILILSFIPEDGTYAEKRFDNVFLVFGLFIAPIPHFIGLGLGIAGAFLKDSKKGFSILGIIFNALPLIFILFVWILLFWVVWAVLSSGGGWR